MNALFQDIRYGLRILAKSPVFTFVAIITLGLGVGVNTAIFSVADAFLLRPVSFPDTDRLVMVMEVSPNTTSEWNTVAPGNYEDWKEQNHSFEALSAGRWRNLNLTGSGEPQRVQGFEVSTNFLDTLKEKPMMGRGFLPDDDAAGHERQVVLGYGLWERVFASDSGIVGTKIKLDGQDYTVAGVMPKGFTFPQSAELWVPMPPGADKNDRAQHTLYVVTRLKPGVSVRQAQAEMNGIASRMAAAYPRTNPGWGVHVIPIAVFATGELTRSYTLMLIGAVAFVLLIACANVANLQLARSTFRERGMAVRLSLGAGRWRVVRQVLTESALLGLGGVALGIVLAQWGVHLILAYMPPDVAKYLPGWDTIAVNWRAFGYALTLALSAAILSGLVPALQSSRVNVNSALKDGSRGGTATRSRHRMRGAFVLLQVSLSLVLLVGSGLMAKGVWALIAVNEDSSPQTLLTFNLNLRGDRYATPQQKTAFCDRILSEIESLPGIKGAALVSQVPFGEGGDLNTDVFSIEGRAVTSSKERHSAVPQYVSPGYLPMMGVALRKGRWLTTDDTAQTVPVALINERMAHRLWPNQDAIGKRVRWGSDQGAEGWMTIVGIVADVRNSWISDQPEPTIYSPYGQAPRAYTVVVMRTAGSPDAMIASVRKRVAGIDPALPLYEMKSYDQVIHESVLGLEYAAVMLTVLGVIALVLAAVGLYGVISYLVTLRWREIGIRMALGAQRREVLGMAIGWGASLMLLGVLAGLLFAVGLARLLSGLIYGVKAGDLQVFFVSTVALLASAMLATFIPALRASRVDPMVALRYE